MKPAHLVWSVLLLAWPCGAGAQQIKPLAVSPRVGETIAIELDRALRANESASWTVASGPGEIIPDRTGARISFRATGEGRVVVLCVIRDPNQERRVTLQFSVDGSGAAPPPVPPPSATGPPAPQPARVPPPAPPVQKRAASPDVLPLKDIDLILPSGWMGDAMTENGETARIDPGETNNCRSGPTCYRIEYDKGGKLGWTAFGLQFVPEGASMNYGELPGMNLSDRGFRSIRVWAKTATVAKVQFKSGGNVAPKFANTNGSSYSVAGPTVPLSTTYREYCLDLREKSLRNIVSPLTIVLTRAANPSGAVVFVDDISFSTTACSTQ